MEAPDPKRARVYPPPPPDWRTNSMPSPRSLPPPVQPPYPHHNHPPSFQHTEGPQSHNSHDRRPQEHSYYEQPQQEQLHRPGPGPPHNYQRPLQHSPQSYSAPPTPQLKKDPSEGPQHIYRPSSTSNGSDHNVNSGTHHEPSGRPLPYDSARPENFQPSPFQSTASPMAEPYHGKAEPYSPYSNNGLPNTREHPFTQYPAAQRTDSQSQVKRKAQRAAQACDSCRTLKAKCDEGRPSCGSCREKGIPCNYRDPAPKPTDKATADLLERMDEMRQMLNERFTGLERELESLKNSMRNIITEGQPVERKFKQEADDSNLQAMPASHRPSIGQNPPLTASQYISNFGQQRHLQAEPERMMPEEKPAILSASTDVSEGEEEEAFANPGPTGASLMPSGHKTTAANLLDIPEIAAMTMKTNKDSKWFKKVGGIEFPYETESRRGTLRLYGRGEGNDFTPGYDKEQLADRDFDLAPGDSPYNAPSPDGFRDERGQIGGFTPPPHPDYPHREFQRGDINPVGMPDLSEATVRGLVGSYQQNINNMHPLFTPKALEDLVRVFLKNIPDGPSQAKPKLQAFIGGGGGYIQDSPGGKRKRSPGSGDYLESSFITPEYKTGHPWRNMTTCLVLLMMALGKICISGEKISEYYADVERDSESCSPDSPVYRNGHASPMNRSSSITTPNVMGSPHDMERQRSRSRRPSVENNAIPRTTPSRSRNIDRFPGLSYFAIATDIIGNHIGANGLQHVHANILAALYQAQITRVIESSAFLFNAGQGLRMLLEKKRGRFKSIKENLGTIKREDNPLVFTFWTCLQLESDIIAEMSSLPQSGIMSLEEDMPVPNYSEAQQDGFDQTVIASYMAQLFLRKHLNSLHNTLYRPKTDLTPKMFFQHIEASIENLTDIKTWASSMYWDPDKGDQATDILNARLRAKFYGAQVITYRFFVLQLLEGSRPSQTVPEIAVGEKTQRDYASKGLRALIHSTKAFHLLAPPGDKRLIVTNVWGTAHAQWGNMLVLQAAYMSPVLKPLLLEHINFPELQHLYALTVRFLRSLASKKSALAVDLKILYDVGMQSGFARRGEDMTTSFGSTDTQMTGSQQY